MEKKVVYLDYAASAPPEESVAAAMMECMRRTPYNASAAYSAAGEARRVHRLCREQLGEMLGCTPDSLYFTSGGTEANNWAIHAFADGHAVISALEHASVLRPAQAYCRVTLVSPDAAGMIEPEKIAAALRPDTRLICLQAANNETGVIQPVKEVYALARARGVHLHVDAVQAFGHIPLRADCCDSMSLSAHKLGGPRGIGALYARKPLPPLLLGGSQESGLRAGTENTPAIAGFHQAALLAAGDQAERAAREEALMRGFIGRLRTALPGLRLLGEERARLPGIAALALPGGTAAEAVAALDLQGILVSGGAACAARSGRPSHVYTAMGLSEKEAARVLRVSIGRHTTAEELKACAQALIAFISAPDRQSIF